MNLKSFKRFLLESSNENKTVYILTNNNIIDKEGIKETDFLDISVKKLIDECDKNNVKNYVVYSNHATLIKKDGDLFIQYVNIKNKKSILNKIDKENDYFIIRRGTDESDLDFIKSLEMNGIKTFNNSESIKICNDKYLSYELMSSIGIKSPKTAMLANFDENGLKNFLKEFNNSSFPVIVKTVSGSAGVGVMKFDDFNTMFQVVQLLWQKGMKLIIQEFINIDKDIRTIVIDNKVITSMIRYKKDDVRSNQVGKENSEVYEPSKEEISQCLKLAKKVGTYYSGIDYMKDKDGNLYFIEINSSAGTDIIEKVTGIKIMEKFLNGIINK